MHYVLNRFSGYACGAIYITSCACHDVCTAACHRPVLWNLRLVQSLLLHFKAHDALDNAPLAWMCLRSRQASLDVTTALTQILRTYAGICFLCTVSPLLYLLGFESLHPSLSMHGHTMQLRWSSRTTSHPRDESVVKSHIQPCGAQRCGPATRQLRLRCSAQHQVYTLILLSDQYSQRS